MSKSERYFVTMPEEIPTFTDGFRVAPNEGSFPVDATVYVSTEDNYFMTFKMFKKGPAQKDYLISLVESEPPLSEHPLAEKEVYVRGDTLIRDREFILDSAWPHLSKTAFKAVNIVSNVQEIVLPPIE